MFLCACKESKLDVCKYCTHDVFIHLVSLLSHVRVAQDYSDSFQKMFFALVQASMSVKVTQLLCPLLCVISVVWGQPGECRLCLCTLYKTVTVQVLTVYLSLGPTNINTNNTEVLITDIGEDGSGGLPSLTCHTDLTTCCRDSDTGGQGGRGEWYYPDGRMVPSQVAWELLYKVRNAPQVIRLARRDRLSIYTPILSPTGSYCCVIPTTEGVMTFCANIGECVDSVQ